jgi:hypothetical protein
VDVLAGVVVAAFCLPPVVRAAATFLARLLTDPTFRRGLRTLRASLRQRELLREIDEWTAGAEASYREGKERARRLLARNLNEAQQRTFSKGGFIDVRSSGGRVYRLALSGSVARFSKDETYLSEYYCIGPTRPMPLEDRLLALKLTLETDEEQFLETAYRRTPA